MVLAMALCLFVPGINRYIVGCKCQGQHMCLQPQSELIDTQWDVNIVASRYDYVNVFELIDTQWDVNV